MARETYVYDKLDYRYPVSEGPCEVCGEEIPCMSFHGRMLCYHHWHGERAKEPCFRVAYADALPFHIFCDYVEEEAVEVAQEEEKKRERAMTIVRSEWGTCGKIGHPGYHAVHLARIAHKYGGTVESIVRRIGSDKSWEPPKVLKRAIRKAAQEEGLGPVLEGA